MGTEDQKTDRPVFIVGMPRSGTTLIATMLDAHPRIAISAPESHFLDWWLPEYGHLDLSRPEDFDLFWREFTLDDRWPHYGIERRPTREAILARDRVDHRAFFDTILRQYAARFGKPRRGEKTPAHFWHLDTLFEWFPDARLIFTVRDPRAVVASLVKVPWHHNYYFAHAQTWRECMKILERRASDPRVYPLRYEDLVRDPEGTLRPLCEWLGEDFDPRMIEREGADHRLSHQKDWSFDHQKNALGSINAESLDKWRKQFTPAEVSVIELLTAEHMRKHGYEAESRDSRLTAFVRLWRARTARFALRVKRRLWLAAGRPDPNIPPDIRKLIEEQNQERAEARRLAEIAWAQEEEAPAVKGDAGGGGHRAAAAREAGAGS